MKVGSSIRSRAGKCLVVLAVVAFATEARSLSLFRPFRPQGGTAFTVGVAEDGAYEAFSGIDERIPNVLRRRMGGLGLEQVKIYGMGRRRLQILIPGIDAESRAKVRQSLQRMGYLEFRLTHPRNRMLAEDVLGSGKVPEGYVASASGDGFVRVGNYHEIAAREDYQARLAAFGKPPQGYQFMLEKNKEGVYIPNYVSRKTELTGEYLVSACVERDQVGRPVVGFKLNSKGGNLMRKLTRNYIAYGAKNPTDQGRELAIVLDGELISAPVLQSEMSTRGQISGSFTIAEAQRLANDLNAGALPVPLEILAEDTWVEY